MADNGGSMWQIMAGRHGGQQQVDVVDNGGLVWWIMAGRHGK